MAASVTRATKRKRLGKGTLGEFEDEDEEEEEEVDPTAVEGGESAAVVLGDDGEPIVPKKKEKKDKVQKEYLGPWAGWEDENMGAAVPTDEQWAAQEAAGGAPLTKKQRTKAVLEEGKKHVGFGEEKSIYHGTLPSSFFHESGD